ncbi:nuclear transport factor 2 family protein [Phenylobacterium aquaticum]|uniref:nuclear transport factor 2 family protein n=1 Tax=Phenylobacterium aquaticum TaxID=1763816 RepID=UPI001F5E2EC2|nr:nuclear transport factor 2 family protein [Phenylobacterium aquaticum]MCI3132483.1 nuclear transport factor 2 family protein [Phenylobacterium aquaticum]
MAVDRRGLGLGLAAAAVSTAGVARAGTHVEVERAVRARLARFSDLCAARDPHLVDEFLDPALFAGSGVSERAMGRDAMIAQFKSVFAQPVRIAFAWDQVRIDQAGDIAWLFAEGFAVATPDKGEVQRSPYRLSGVLQRRGDDWLWRQWTGSEPVKD